MEKRGFLVSALLALVCILVFSAGSRALPWPYIGLYTDAAHSIDRQDISAYTMFTTWVWALPSDYGMQCAYFKLSAPDWLIPTGITANPDTAVTMGSPFDADGVSMCFASGNCQTSWVWLYQIKMLAVTTPVPGYIELVEYYTDRKNPYSFSCCPCGWDSIEPFRVLNKLGLNQDAFIGTKETSWGAIKELYRGH